jgi:uroporphyrinogen decarboxylase
MRKTHIGFVYPDFGKNGEERQIRMSRIDNFEETMRHRKPRDLILDLGGNPLSGLEGNSQENLMKLLGLAGETKERNLFGKIDRIDERILRHLDIDTRSVGEILHPENSQFEFLADDLYIDEWGIKRKFTGAYWDVVDPPLKGATAKDLDSYFFPDADSIDRGLLGEMEADAKKLWEKGEYVICAEHPVYGIFELGCWLCGFDDFLMKLFIDEEFVIKLFDKILEYQKKIIDLYYGALGKYIHYTSSGDDFAMQNNLFMPPETFQKLIKPYLKERIEYTKRYTDAYFLHHSCGNVYKIIGDLIEIGVEILNPIQPVTEEMAPSHLKQGYGKEIVFHGGIDTQELLNFGSSAQIEEAVHETVEILNRDGGYIFAAAHNLQDDVPPENIVTMFEAARKYGRKR